MITSTTTIAGCGCCGGTPGNCCSRSDFDYITAFVDGFEDYSRQCYFFNGNKANKIEAFYSNRNGLFELRPIQQNSCAPFGLSGYTLFLGTPGDLDNPGVIDYRITAANGSTTTSYVYAMTAFLSCQCQLPSLYVGGCIQAIQEFNGQRTLLATGYTRQWAMGIADGLSTTTRGKTCLTLCSGDQWVSTEATILDTANRCLVSKTCYGPNGEDPCPNTTRPDCFVPANCTYEIRADLKGYRL